MAAMQLLQQQKHQQQRVLAAVAASCGPVLLQQLRLGIPLSTGAVQQQALHGSNWQG
jgi:hypothetical protein